jgi:sugar O-acyltransferase (sialic acid O-acetyltransferase NeuD family)
METIIGLNQNKKKINIAIIGASGGSFEVYLLLKKINKIYKNLNIVGFYDDNISKCPEIAKKNYLGKFKKIKLKKNILFCTGIGNENNFHEKENIIKSLKINKEFFPNIIDPDIYISDCLKIGYGNVIFSGCYVGLNVVLGDFNLIKPISIISHDCQINSFNIINANCNISGNVKISNLNYFGAGSTVKQDIKIKNKNLIGLGTKIIKDINSNYIIYDKLVSIKNKIY